MCMIDAVIMINVRYYYPDVLRDLRQYQETMGRPKEHDHPGEGGEWLQERGGCPSGLGSVLERGWDTSQRIPQTVG